VTAVERVLAHPPVARITRALLERPGTRLGAANRATRAAVALIVRLAANEELELLMIKRAAYERDPWSGHVALPGGRWERGDASLEDTAIRETLEETAIDLRRGGHLVGALDEVEPRTPLLPPLVIRPVIFALGELPRLALSHEVEHAFWVPLSALLHPEASQDMELIVGGASRTVSALQHGEHVIWGLTERILRDFFARMNP